MRQYNIISQIILILSVINFALVAPVLVQKKRQVCLDVLHVPMDMMSVFGETRWLGEVGDAVG